MATDLSTEHQAPDARRRRVTDRDGENAVSAHDLNAYIDGELPMAKRRIMELRLATDAAVRSRVAELVRVRELMRLAYGTVD
jgi:anti-sigma factor RsiW